MPDNPFAKYVQRQDPVIAVDPYKQQDQAFKQQSNARAAEDQARQNRAEARATEVAARTAKEWAATHDADGTPKPTRTNQPTEFQSKSAGFYGRMVQAERDFNAVPEGARDARTLSGQTLHDWAPGLENSLPGFLGGNSPDRQKADQAARNFIAATLRQESGAAISAGEYENQYKIFFPQPGDSAAVIRQKADARKQAVQGFRVAAGPLAEQVVPKKSPVAGKSGWWGEQGGNALLQAGQGGQQGWGNFKVHN